MPHADDPTPRPAAGAPPGRRATGYNARLGLVLFFVYLLLYGGFVTLAAFDPPAMGRPAVAGVNVAVVYGFGLIVAAFVLALVYMALCRREPADGAEATADAEGTP